MRRFQHKLPVIVSALLGAGVFLFWWRVHPEWMNYHEQNQLFLWTGDYFCERISIAGGLADWLGEFIVQFFYVEWLGALLLTGLFLAMQRLSYCLLDGHQPVRIGMSLVLPLFLLWLMGDENVLLSLPVATALALSAALLARRWHLSALTDILIIPLLYWLIGPVVWLYVLIRLICHCIHLRRQPSARGIKLQALRLWPCALPLWLVAIQWLSSLWLLPQWPSKMVWTGLNYYRIPMQWPCLHGGYDGNKYELLKLDRLIRQERWEDVVERARHHEVQTTFWSNCVNLSLAMTGQLPDSMFDFYQSGPDALLMPMVRDMTSNLPTAEAFWRLGMVNSAQRYMSDIQESILNGRKSGRCEKRIVECMIVNGHYAIARKHIQLLKKSLFYSSWAEEAEQYLDNEEKINTHPVWGRIRQLRFKQNFLFYHAEMAKMLAMLFEGNKENRLALQYFLCQLLLNGDGQSVQVFQMNSKLMLTMGGRQAMPRAFADAMECIGSRKIGDTPYGKYIQRTKGGKP